MFVRTKGVTRVVRTAVLGYPRMGVGRELKKALESYWSDPSTQETLTATASAIRREHWRIQRDAGITLIPCGDFSLYDHVLDTAVMVGAVPPRFAAGPGAVDLDTYFAMARGGRHRGADVTALEMTKWLSLIHI